ncbi:MAG: autotransporter domain-containing protein, partial [Xanthobacteraceae bacterium]
AFGAGGGDGYGGAIFVNSTGTLVLTGNSTFSGNNAYGGSSLDGGVAGGGAGTDLFMMTGATVQIAPGAGNTITFNGTIADNSISSIGTANGAGTGASLTTYAGLTVFNGVDTYSGQTIINGGALAGPLNIGSNTALNYGITAGTLQATDGVGLPTDSFLNFAGPNQFTGGVLQTSGLFDRWVGVFDPTNQGVASRVEWTGSGGFAAINGPLTVMLDSGAPLVWGTDGFVPFGSSLMFGSANSTDLVNFTNAVDISGGTASVLVVNNGNANSVAAMTGVISGSGALSVGGGGYGGTLILTGVNTYTGGTSVTSAALAINSDAALGAASGALALDNGVLIATGNITSARTITLTGPSNVIDTDMNSVTLSGNIGGAGALMTSGGGSLNLSGTDTYTGGTFIGAGTTLTTTGPAVLPSGGSIVVVSPGGVQTDVFTGTVNVTGPLDLVNGTPPELIITPGESLEGVGTVNVAVIVEGGGNNAPGDGPGTIVVSAPVTDLSGATYTVAVDGPTSSVGCPNPAGCAGAYSSTIVAGAGNTYTAAGTLAPVLRGIAAPANNNYTPPVTANFVIVQAQGGVLGSFSGITQPATGLAPGTRFDALYGPNGATPFVNSDSITLYVTPADYTNLSSFGVNLSTNQYQVAGALNALRGPAGLNNNLAATMDFGVLFLQQPSALPHDFDTLSGEVNADAAHGALEATNRFLNLMVDPAVNGRDGSIGGAALGFAPENDATPPSDAVTAFNNILLPAKNPSPAPLASLDERWNAWGSVFGGANSATSNATTGTHNLIAATYGFAGGMDYHLLPDTVTGFALGGGGGNWGVADALGNGRSDMFEAGLYSKSRFGAAYFATALAVSNQWMTTDRTTFTGEQLTARFDAQTVGGRLEGGYRYAMGWMGVTPYGAFQAQAFHSPNYSESDLDGGNLGLFGLSYGAETTTDLSSELGARFDGVYSLANGMQFVWNGLLAWQHDWITNPGLAATFEAASAPGALAGAPVSFNVNGAALPTNTALVAAGADLHLTPSITLGAKFDSAFARTSLTYGGNATLRYAW